MLAAALAVHPHRRAGKHRHRMHLPPRNLDRTARIKLAFHRKPTRRNFKPARNTDWLVHRAMMTEGTGALKVTPYAS
jgi:hypothetical protein